MSIKHGTNRYYPRPTATAGGGGCGCTISTPGPCDADITIGKVGDDLQFKGLNAGTGITLADSGTCIQISATGTVSNRNYVHIGIGDSPYAALVTDDIIGVDTSGGIVTVVLPGSAAVSSGKTFIVKDETGDASTNPILVDATPGDTIDGALNFPVNFGRGSAQLYADGGTAYFVY